MKCDKFLCKKEAVCFRLIEINDCPIDMETNLCAEHDAESFLEPYEVYSKKEREYLISCGIKI